MILPFKHLDKVSKIVCNFDPQANNLAQRRDVKFNIYMNIYNVQVFFNKYILFAMLLFQHPDWNVKCKSVLFQIVQLHPLGSGLYIGKTKLTKIHQRNVTQANDVAPGPQVFKHYWSSPSALFSLLVWHLVILLRLIVIKWNG